MTHRTGRHRAPAAHSRTLSTLAATGAALSASLLTPATALAGPAHPTSRHPGDYDGAYSHPHSQGTKSRGAHHRAVPHTVARHLRPMTSGERQYRNGCLQGYISEDCHAFSVTELLRHGISPFE
jgi:hypothetical protein